MIRVSIGRTIASALAALAVTTALCGCTSSGGPFAGTSPDGSGGVVDQTLARSSALASALDWIRTCRMSRWRSPTGRCLVIGRQRTGTRPRSPKSCSRPTPTWKRTWASGPRARTGRSTRWPAGGGAGTFVLGFDRHADLAAWQASSPGSAIAPTGRSSPARSTGGTCGRWGCAASASTRDGTCLSAGRTRARSGRCSRARAARSAMPVL